MNNLLYEYTVNCELVPFNVTHHRKMHIPPHAKRTDDDRRHALHPTDPPARSRLPNSVRRAGSGGLQARE